MTTETKQETTIETTPPVAGPLALRDDAPLVAWTEEKRRLIREQVCPAGITPGEFEVFMLQCIRSGLDPLIKQAFCVTRNMKVKEKQRGPNGGEMTVERYKEVHVFQPAVAGMLSRAESFPDYRGTIAGVFYEGEQVFPDIPGGKVAHSNVRNAAQGPGKIAGAYAIVMRDGRVPVVSVRYWSECYDDRNPVWKTYGRAMMLKCPQAEALRLAFPTQFGGLYDEAESRTVEMQPSVDGSAFTAAPMEPPPALRAAPTREELEEGEIVHPPDDEEPPPPEAEFIPEALPPEEQLADPLAELRAAIAAAASTADLKVLLKQINALPGEARAELGKAYNSRRAALAKEGK